MNSSEEFSGHSLDPFPSILDFFPFFKFLSRFWFGNNFKKGEISVVSFIGIASLTCLSRGKQGGNKIWTSSRRRQIDYYQNTHTHTHRPLICGDISSSSSLGGSFLSEEIFSLLTYSNTSSCSMFTFLFRYRVFVFIWLEEGRNHVDSIPFDIIIYTHILSFLCCISIYLFLFLKRQAKLARGQGVSG